MRILHIEASPRGPASASTRLAGAYLEALRKARADVQVENLNLYQADIPAFVAPAAAAKYKVMSGQADMNQPEAQAWKPVIDTINHFQSFDWYLISTGMWNFSIPYRLKQYIDVIVQPGLTVSYDPAKGYVGLVTGKKAVLALARGGQYELKSPYDLQRPYLELILGFIGITDVRTVVAEPMLMAGPEQAARSLEESARRAAELAAAMARE